MLKTIRGPGSQRASYWYSEKILRDVIKDLMHTKKFVNWIREVNAGMHQKRLEFISYHMKKPVGAGYVRTLGVPRDWIAVEWTPDMKHATFVFEPGGPLGFNLVTAYPSVPRARLRVVASPQDLRAAGVRLPQRGQRYRPSQDPIKGQIGT